MARPRHTASSAGTLYQAAVFALGLLALLAPALVSAQSLGGALGDESISNKPIMLVLSLAVTGLAPLVLVLGTSFTKIAVVLAIVRQAVGSAQIPPTQVLTGLSLLLTLVIMAPLGLNIWHEGEGRFNRLDIQTFDQFVEPDVLLPFVEIAAEPVREFLMRHGHASEQAFFLRLTQRVRSGRSSLSTSATDFAVLMPAFVLSELKEAFFIGLLLFLPFLAIDEVVANILMALGMQMLSPQSISLPFKVLLFVMVDGWALLCRGLILGYEF